MMKLPSFKELFLKSQALKTELFNYRACLNADKSKTLIVRLTTRLRVANIS